MMQVSYKGKFIFFKLVLIYPVNCVSPFNIHKWVKYNFSLQHPYTVQQTGNKNTQTC